MSQRETEAEALAVLFDMDGVIIDSKPVIEGAWRQAASAYGIEISEEQMHQHIHGRPGRHTISTIFRDLAVEDQRKVQAMVIGIEEVAPYQAIPGAVELIAQLNAAGVTVGLVTSGWKVKIDHVIKVLALGNPFAATVDLNDVKNGKPHPEPYLLGAERLGLPASRTIVFEDSASGVQSATAAGATCVGIGEDSLRAHGAKTTIRDFREMTMRADSTGRTVLLKSRDCELVVVRR